MMNPSDYEDRVDSLRMKNDLKLLNWLSYKSLQKKINYIKTCGGYVL